MFSCIRVSVLAASPLLLSSALPSQAQNSEQLEVGPPPQHRVDPPAAGATPQELEQRGDELKEEKNFLDAIDYYQAALKTAPAKRVRVQQDRNLPTPDAALQRGQKEFRTRHQGRS
jgi:hypothetical protein